jgi:hypothetical protein
MTSYTDSPGTRLSDGGHDRAPLEEAMAKHEARQKWLRPLVWLSATVLLAGVVIGVLFVVFLENKSVSPLEGDPNGIVLRSVVKTVSENMPLGSRLLSHRYREPTWHNCSPPKFPSGYSDIQAQFVYYIPPSAGTASKLRGKPHKWVLVPSSAPYSWHQTVILSGPNGQYPIWSDVALSAKVISGSTGIWAIDGSSAAFGESSSYCGGPG